MAVRIHGVHLVQLALVLIALLTNRLDGFGDGRVVPHADDVGGHQPAGRVLRILEQPLDLGAIADLGEHCLALAG